MDPHIATFSVETDRLLSPIAVDEPTGTSLRYEGTYDRINDLRREDDPALDQGVWQTELKTADWPQVAQACWLAIETQSKDIQIAAWLLESWIHLHGVAGVREGLHLIAELCDTYWDGLHPDLQDGDLDYRLAPLVWIDEKLSIAVKLIPVTCPQSEDVSRYTIADWELACRTPGRKTGDRREEVTLERIQQSAALTPAPWLSQVARDARGALAALQELHEVLAGRCGRQAPALSKLRDTLESIRGLLSTALQGRMPAPEASAPSETPRDEVDGAPYAGEPGRFPVRSRAEAYQLLAQAAEYLARTEPHSPVPYLVRRAITWGGLGLEDLLPELVRDGDQVSQIYQLLQLGAKPRRP
jgi:type VI secretion system protein ImpA